MTQQRGQLTDRIKKRSNELLGYTITQNELRLLAYIQYVMMNEQRLDPGKVTQEERSILAVWRGMNLMEGGASGLSITREFWEIMCELLFLGYVDLS